MNALFSRIVRLRQRFWLLPATGIGVALLAGLGLPRVDDALRVDPGVFGISNVDAARTVLATIATVTVSVAGITFSVTVVALQLASQQLGPRVLRTFQADRLNQAVLALFLGTAVYALVLTSQLSAPGDRIPEISIALASAAAVAAFALFVAFIHNIITSLQASTVIARITDDARAAVEHRYPNGIGAPPDDPAAAMDVVSRRQEGGRSIPVRATAGGYLTAVRAQTAFEAAAEVEGILVQHAVLGEFVVSGTLLGELVACGDHDGDLEAVATRARDAFVLARERTIPYDVGFPIRQLADMALRALSPSLNDPTTAENAMGAITGALVDFAQSDHVEHVRIDDAGEPRLLAAAPGFDDLVKVGFEQVRLAAAGHTVLCRRLLTWLEHLEHVAHECGVDADEVRRQARRLREEPGVGQRQEGYK